MTINVTFKPVYNIWTMEAEQAFVTAFLSTLASQPVTYPDDYQQQPEHSLKRVPVLPVS